MKAYEKPTFKSIEMRVEERIAKNSSNCHAERGKPHCDPAVLWSNNDQDPQ